MVDFTEFHHSRPDWCNMHESELWSSMGELNTIQKPVKQGRRSGDGPACQPDVQSFLVVFSWWRCPQNYIFWRPGKKRWAVQNYQLLREELHKWTKYSYLFIHYEPHDAKNLTVVHTKKARKIMFCSNYNSSWRILKSYIIDTITHSWWRASPDCWCHYWNY